MDDPPGISKVSSSVIDNDDEMEKQTVEAEKRLKKVEQDYLHTSQKYTETRSQWLSLYNERRRAVNSCYAASDLIDRCNKLVEQLQNAIDKLPTTETTEETIDHSLDLSTKTLARENMMILQQKAQCQKLDREVIHEFREFRREFNYFQRKVPRSDSRKALHLLKELKEKNKCRDKAFSNCTVVYNLTTHESLRKSLELQIKVLKNLTRVLQKDWEGKLHIEQCARNLYTGIKQKVKHLEKKKELLSGQWGDERKYMLGTKKKHDRRIGTYPEAEFIKMVNDKNHDSLPCIFLSLKSFTFS